MSHEDFGDFIFVKQRMVLIDKDDDEEGILETKSHVEEVAYTKIINTDQETERVSRLEGRIKNLPLFSQVIAQLIQRILRRFGVLG